MRRFTSTTLALTTLFCAKLAAAADPAAPSPAPATASADATVAPSQPATRDRGAFLAGGKVGGIFPFGGLGPNVTGGVEVGYVFPWLKRSFGLAVDLDYAVPTQSGSESDPRLAGGKYSWHLTQKELNLMPVVLYRLTMLGRVVPYVGVGPRIYFLQSKVRSDEGKPTFQETTEQSTKVGFGVPIGVEISLGPGGIIAEALVQYGGLDHTATGASNTGAVNVMAGYRFLL